MKKPLNKAPARLQRMLMKLQRYRFNLHYTLSRAALPQPISAARVTHFDVFRMEMERAEQQEPKTGRDH